MTIVSNNSPIIFVSRDIIFDMLSYLAIKSLLRFKCVCKHWNDTIQDFQFICLHYLHGTSLIIHKKPLSQTHSNGEDEFKPLFSKGLILEFATRRSSHSPFSHNLRYRVRNPEMLHHQILEIPDSQSIILHMCIVFDPYYPVMKLLSVVYEFIGDRMFGYEVLDLRNDEGIYSWRPINLPQQSHGGGETRICDQVKRHSKQIRVLIAMAGTVYCIWDSPSNSHIELDILDVLNDRYIGHTSFPKGFYSKENCVLWKKKLIAVAKIIKDEIHVMVLHYDNKKKQIKWAEVKLIIKLPFLKELEVMPQIKILFFLNSKLYFFWREKDSICSFDSRTGKEKIVVPSYRESQVLYVIRPCLFTFKEMQSLSSQ